MTTGDGGVIGRLRGRSGDGSERAAEDEPRQESDRVPRSRRRSVLATVASAAGAGAAGLARLAGGRSPSTDTGLGGSSSDSEDRKPGAGKAEIEVAVFATDELTADPSFPRVAEDSLPENGVDMSGIDVREIAADQLDVSLGVIQEASERIPDAPESVSVRAVEEAIDASRLEKIRDGLEDPDATHYHAWAKMLETRDELAAQPDVNLLLIHGDNEYGEHTGYADAPRCQLEDGECTSGQRQEDQSAAVAWNAQRLLLPFVADHDDYLGRAPEDLELEGSPLDVDGDGRLEGGVDDHPVVKHYHESVVESTDGQSNAGRSKERADRSPYTPALFLPEHGFGRVMQTVVHETLHPLGFQHGGGGAFVDDDGNLYPSVMLSMYGFNGDEGPNIGGENEFTAQLPEWGNTGGELRRSLVPSTSHLDHVDDVLYDQTEQQTRGDGTETTERGRSVRTSKAFDTETDQALDGVQVG